MSDEREDVLAAAHHARTHAQPPGVLPHHLRCNWVRGSIINLQRCRLAEGHPSTQGHEFEEPKR